MDRPRPPRHNDQLAVKKVGKKINKTPLHLPNGYTSKNRFLRRSIVPQLTSSPPKIRPAALTQINRPHHVPPPMPPQRMMGRHADQFWSNIAAESPLSVSFQSSSGDSRPHGYQMQQSHQYQSHSPLLYNNSLPSARFSGGGGILPTPVSFRDSGPNRNQMQPSHDYQQPPRFNGSASSVPILPSPRFDGPGISPTPPGVQYPSPLKPRGFTSSSMAAQGGILGPGKFPHASTGLVFPPSPFGENTY